MAAQKREAARMCRVCRRLMPRGGGKRSAFTAHHYGRRDSVPGATRCPGSDIPWAEQIEGPGPPPMPADFGGTLASPGAPVVRVDFAGARMARMELGRRLRPAEARSFVLAGGGR